MSSRIQKAIVGAATVGACSGLTAFALTATALSASAATPPAAPGTVATAPGAAAPTAPSIVVPSPVASVPMITPPAATPPATDLATEIAQAALAAVPGGKLISTQVTIKGYAAQVETPSGATVLVLLNKQFDVLDIVTESATPPLAAPTAAAVARAALTAVPGSALLRTEATQNGYAAQVYSPLGVHLLVVLTKQLDVVDILTVPAGE